jgi:serine/threonine protein kinase
MECKKILEFISLGTLPILGTGQQGTVFEYRNNALKVINAGANEDVIHPDLLMYTYRIQSEIKTLKKLQHKPNITPKLIKYFVCVNPNNNNTFIDKLQETSELIHIDSKDGHHT